MAWWQKKLLHYALSRTGLLDDQAIDPQNLDIALGRTNVIELRDVGLNIKRLSKLAQLPPSLRVETARVLLLRLTVPADIYQSSIGVEVDGVVIGLVLEEKEAERVAKSTPRTRSPLSGRTPQHRKVHRRVHPPPQHDRDRLDESDIDIHIPTTQEMARSFLLDEPAQKRRELEAALAADASAMEQSTDSDSSEGELGTGISVGLPSFLAGFLQGIIDRLQVRISKVEVTIETIVSGDGPDRIPLALRIIVGAGELAGLQPGVNGGETDGRRRFTLHDIGVDLRSNASIFADLADPPSYASAADNRRSRSSPGAGNAPTVLRGADLEFKPKRPSTTEPLAHSGMLSHDQSPHSKLPDTMSSSARTADSDCFASDAENAEQGRESPSQRTTTSELDIQLGDDNISWGSRRVQSSVVNESLWNSFASEDDLPDSLLLERAHTPRAHSALGETLPATRTRRPVAPYARDVRSHGSWSIPKESTDRRDLRQGPGSWPMLNQSQHSSPEFFSSAPSVPGPDAMENKRTALEGPSLVLEDPPIPAMPGDEQPDDMTQSRFYSHEEAESMYMSAMTHGSSANVPGAWASDIPNEHSLQHDSKGANKRPTRSDDGGQTRAGLSESPQQADLPSGNITPRAQTPKATRPPDETTLNARRLLTIDTMSVWLPNQAEELEAGNGVSERSQLSTRVETSVSTHGMPGTFSAYPESTNARQKAALLSESQAQPTSSPRQHHDSSPGRKESTRIMLGAVKAHLDIPCARLLCSFGQSTSDPRGSQSDRTDASPGTDNSLSSAVALHLSADTFELALVDRLEDRQQATGKPAQMLLTLRGEKASLRLDRLEMECQMNRAALLLGSAKLLTFDRQPDVTSSLDITQSTPDLLLIVSSSKSTVARQPITEVTLKTLPIRVALDLIAAEDTFSAYGGISGVLQLSNSILSESGTLGSPSPITKGGKGVRFQDDTEVATPGRELKANVRVTGLDVTLIGEACALNLRSTIVKVVHREQATVMAIAQVRLTGPYRSGELSAPISADISTLRMEYLASPPEKDLERLLSLLTPSKDKYDTDDDILIDTLLRQRRKGALARVMVHTADFKIDDYGCFATLTTLSDELAKLSAVTKYLPEDDRPGLLTLVRFDTLRARLPVNDSFGVLQLLCSDLQAAHVGLPALLAVSLGTINAGRAQHADLLRPLIPHANSETLPMLMARMIGNEAEPSVKIKVLNCCIEYDVPTVLALSNVNGGADVEDVVGELAKSVADLTLPKNDSGSGHNSPGSDATVKKTRVDLAVHDSAIGLTPENQSSKGLLAINDATFSTTMPFDHKANAVLDMRKATMLVVDVASLGGTEREMSHENLSRATSGSLRLNDHLSNLGYACVGSIMSARLSVLVEDDNENHAGAVVIDVNNELLLLETCADSTQTLIALLSGLSPPTPPSKTLKYLTEPMSIEDMMASFTGEPEATSDAAPETLFDVDEEPDDDADMLLDAPTLHEDDDLLMESETESSLYGPVSGMLDDSDKPGDDESRSADFSGTVESLLEEDPFEMPISPADTSLGDSALMRDLGKQCKPAINSQPVDLGLYEIEDLGFDALSIDGAALGTQHRFATPTSGRRAPLSKDLQRKPPFRLRLRETNVIWNIHDGYDWQRTRDGITNAVEQVEAQIEERKARRRQSLDDREVEEPVIGDFLFNSIYIGVPGNHDAQELRRQINRGIDDLASETESVPMSGVSRPTNYSTPGRQSKQRQRRRRLKLARSRNHKVAFELNGLSVDVVVSPPTDGDVVSSVDIRVRDCEIFDNVPTSTWRKFLTQRDTHPSIREMSKPMAHIELLNVKTLQDLAATEIVLHVSILPLRLHVDQDTLDFITRFFEFKDGAVTGSETSGERPFIQRVEVDTVDLRLDYKPKYVDYAGLRSGHTTEFMNFVTLDAANIKLKHAIVYGIRGFEPLHKTLNDVWMPDVTRNQLPTVLAGLAPVRSLVNIGSGVRDIVAIPVREYRKDGRIVRSIQKGAFQFGKTTASELARLGAKVAIGTQNILQGAEGLLSPTSASPSGRATSEHGWHDVASDDNDHEQRAISAHANQPLGLLPGLRSARRYLEHDLLTAKDALIAVQGEVLESRNPGAAAAAVVRHAPTLILRPVIGASRAVGTTLLGVGNQIDRSNIRRMDDVSVVQLLAEDCFTDRVSTEVQASMKQICA